MNPTKRTQTLSSISISWERRQVIILCSPTAVVRSPEPFYSRPQTAKSIITNKERTKSKALLPCLSKQVPRHMYHPHTLKFRTLKEGHVYRPCGMVRA